VDKLLTVEVSQVAIIVLRGEIDMAVLGDLQGAIEPFLAPDQTVVLDLSEVTFADSTLLRVLTDARGRISDAGGALLVRNPSDQTRKLLTLGRLDDLVQDEVQRQNET
jgi:anti-anti-sigma factor